MLVTKLEKEGAERFDVHGKKKTRGGNGPPIKDVGEWCYHRRSTVKRAQGCQSNKSARYAAHSFDMVYASSMFRDPYDSKTGLEDLLNNYGSEDLET